jgi:hypothetical protein
MGPGRLETGVLAGTGVALAAIMFGLLTLEGARAPTIPECVDDWNERAAPTQRNQVDAGGFHQAYVHGWLAKLRYPGCSISFVKGPAVPYLSCIRTFRAAVSRLMEWSCEGGRSWGRGRSQGIDFIPDAAVGSDGMLFVRPSSVDPKVAEPPS